MTCEELNARLISQKAALMRMQAQERAFYARIGGHGYDDFVAAKAEYDKASSLYRIFVLGN
jgi:hypothetical protein